MHGTLGVTVRGGGAGRREPDSAPAAPSGSGCLLGGICEERFYEGREASDGQGAAEAVGTAGGIPSGV